MSLRDWSGLRIIGASLGWVVLVLALGLPRVLSVFTGRGSDGRGGMMGVHFGPEAMLVVALVTVITPLILLGMWLWQRVH
jgi:uncharacterized membrane protein